MAGTKMSGNGKLLFVTYSVTVLTITKTGQNKAKCTITINTKYH